MRVNFSSVVLEENASGGVNLCAGDRGAGSPVGAAISLMFSHPIPLQEVGRLLFVYQLPLASSSFILSGSPPPYSLVFFALDYYFLIYLFSSLSPASIPVFIPGCQDGVSDSVYTCMYIWTHSSRGKEICGFWDNFCSLLL